MQQNGIHPRGPCIGLGRLADRGADHAIGLSLRCAQVGYGGRGPLARDNLPGRLAGDVVDPAQQIVDTAASHGSRCDSRHAKLRGEFVQINVDAATPRDVDHVQHQKHRPADALQFDHESQRHAKIGGVGHAEQKVRRAFAGKLAENDVASDVLVRAPAPQ